MGGELLFLPSLRIGNLNLSTKMRNRILSQPRNPSLNRWICLFSIFVFLFSGSDAHADRKDKIKEVGQKMADSYKKGDYEEALRLAKEKLNLIEQEYGPDHAETGKALPNVAALLQLLKRQEEAEPLYLRALAICEKELEPDDPSYGVVINNLASFYYSLAKYREAVPLLTRALEINRKAHGPNHPHTGSTLNNLGYTYKMLGEEEKGEPLLKEALRIWEDKLGPDHIDTMNAVNNLAHLYIGLHKYEEARVYAERALKVREEKLDPNHPDLAVALKTLATVHAMLGEYTKAGPLNVRSLSILKRTLGDQHLQVADSRNRIANIYVALKSPSQALPFAERWLVVVRKYLDQRLSYFGEDDCLLFSANQAPMFLPGRIGDGPFSAKAAILFKGRVFEGISERRNAESLLSQSQSGRELLQKRDALSAGYQKTLLQRSSGNEAVGKMEDQLEALDKEIAIKLDRAGFTNFGKEISLEDIKAALPENACLVETFAYRHWNGRSDWEDRYSSVLIFQDRESLYIPHGAVEPIDKLINRYRDMVQSGPGQRDDAAFSKVEAELFNGLLAPIASKTDPGNTVIFSPDGLLHFLPIGMLRDGKGEPFGKTYPVRYVTSGRDLLKGAMGNHGRAAKSALVLGNPTFRTSGDSQALLAQSDAGDGRGLNMHENLRAGLGEATEGVQFVPLPGTAKEIEKLAVRLTGAGFQINQLSATEATERALIENMKGHSVIHLATHGFFLPRQDRASQRYEISGGSSESGEITNPMYRGGLALSGAQNTIESWKKNEVPAPSNDGILLAAEIANLDLKGTDLVVLSACETGVGESLNGEGVMGMRRALYAAGANHVVMTLWPVDDLATVEVMEKFYTKYLQGIDASTALASVQNEMMDRWTEEFGAAEAVRRLGPFICTSLEIRK